jgi:dihydroorotase
MIDPHAHLRDWSQAAKETVRHGMEVAWRAGLDAVFEMPNTDPPLTSLEVVKRRIALADAARGELGGDIVHGLYVGLTGDLAQLDEAVRIHAAFYPRVVGLKLYAGHSTGGMGIVTEGGQRAVYRRLAALRYGGVLAVHAEKESLLRTLPGGSPDWDPSSPWSHAEARPPLAEVRSVEDQLRLAAEEGFRGVLHIAHLSVPDALERIRDARRRAPGFRITCGITPHHALLSAEDMHRPDGILLKMNPPLRPRALQESMLRALLGGEIDWIETDHAPHTLVDKTRAHASGIPVCPFYPRVLAILATLGASPDMLEALTHRRMEEAFGFPVRRRERAAEVGLGGEYPFDPFTGVS